MSSPDDSTKSGIAWICTLVAMGWYLHDVAAHAALPPSQGIPWLPGSCVVIAVTLAILWRIRSLRADSPPSTVQRAHQPSAGRPDDPTRHQRPV